MSDRILEVNEIVQFTKTKEFKFIKSLGVGGTGSTHLFLDTTTDIEFAIKKYDPKPPNLVKECYNRFVDEIKILFNISHPNIVRIYNYYLYPKFYKGYLQMEYIEGSIISEHEYFPFDDDSKTWENAFKELISAFKYLESKNILHRDIKPSNIIIDKSGNVKIIDFGFGKKLDTKEEIAQSIRLKDWDNTLQADELIDDNSYTIKTEIFFLGKMFYKILKEKSKLNDFKYKHILDKMIKVYVSERYQSFEKIERDISSGLFLEINFSNKEKEIYRKFASILESIVFKHINFYETENDSNNIISKLGKIIEEHSLEDYLQVNNKLVKVFITSNFSFYSSIEVSMDDIKDFYKFFISLDNKKQEIVLQNLYSRLSKKEIEYDEDEFPF